MKINFINKHGNIEEFDTSNNTQRADQFDNIWGVYFEKKQEVKKEKAKELDYRQLLKDNGVRSTHLLSDTKAKEKCNELWLL